MLFLLEILQRSLARTLLIVLKRYWRMYTMSTDSRDLNESIKKTAKIQKKKSEKSKLKKKIKKLEKRVDRLETRIYFH
jgi:uncharacterized FlaG/YvyC family protein